VTARTGASAGEPLYFEDLDLDTEWRTGARTITEADVVAFAGVSGDFNPIHVDGLVTQSVAVVNQRDETVAEGEFMTLMKRRARDA
jgi:acyl dehydratase